MMDTGLHNLVAIARFYQLPAEPDQLADEFCAPRSALVAFARSKLGAIRSLMLV
ncbi:MAG: hypothetical protein ACJAUP_003575 [Cellvibrionaceae bacterium]|jgi:hypothetical protein